LRRICATAAPGTKRHRQDQHATIGLYRQAGSDDEDDPGRDHWHTTAPRECNRWSY
jgi:hypothetical protein